MARGRKSEPTELTTKLMAALQRSKVFGKLEQSGNTIHAMIEDVEFKFSPKDPSGTGLVAGGYTALQCIKSVTTFLRENKMNCSSSAYTNWRKELHDLWKNKTDKAEGEKFEIPNLQQVQANCDGTFPARAILNFIIEGKYEETDEVANAICKFQNELNSQ